MNKKIIAISVLIAVLFVSAIAGTIFYYNNKVSNLNSQISNLKSQLTQLKSLTSAQLVASLSITEILGNDSTSGGKPTPIPYNYLYISGGVRNIGEGNAYNAGLHVVAYTADGTLEIDITVPLSGGIYGTDSGTNAYVLKTWGGGGSNMELGIVYTENIASLDNPDTISILHEGTVANWTVTPVWTNSP